MILYGNFLRNKVTMKENKVQNFYVEFNGA